MLAGGVATAQSEPTMDQIYSTAKAGRLDDAQVMLQQVLLSHPKSAKAFYVQSELYARQGNLERARASLEKAEQIAPGLPFAKPESVQELRNQLNARAVNKPAPAVQYSSQVPQHSSGSWLLPLLLAGGVIFAGYLLFRRRTPDTNGAVPNIGNPQPYGNGGMPSGFPQPGYPPGYAQQPSLGGRIAGGVATGLAVGAGVLAAEAIGRSLMGDHNSASAQNLGSSNYEPLAGNSDMGGNDFGINDTSSWDDAGGGDFGGGGGDWDN